MPTKTEIVAIVSGTLIIAAGVALELADKAVPPELWIAAATAFAGGLGLAQPSSAIAGIASDLSKLAGYLTAKAEPAAVQPEPAPAATATGDGPAVVAPLASPSATAAPAPATSPNDAMAVTVATPNRVASVGRLS